MKDEDRKLLTEKLLGECWHEYGNIEYTRPDGYKLFVGGCLKCKLTNSEFEYDYDFRKNKYIPRHRTFTTPDDFFAVKGKLVEKGLWKQFYDYATWMFAAWVRLDNETKSNADFIDWLINPARFCELAVEFGKEVLGWKENSLEK